MIKINPAEHSSIEYDNEHGVIAEMTHAQILHERILNCKGCTSLVLLELDINLLNTLLTTHRKFLLQELKRYVEQ